MQNFKIDFPSVSLFKNFPHNKINVVKLDPQKPLFRSHNSQYPWLFFDESEWGRFNGFIPSSAPSAISGFMLKAFGGCYVSNSSLGAISESIFRNIHQNDKKFIERSVLSSRRMTEIILSDDICLKLVDVTSAKTRTQLGIDTQIFSTPDYDVCFAWAHLFRFAGYHGIKYKGRNLEYDCYVLFTNDEIEEDFGDSVGLLDSERFLPEVERIAEDLGVSVEQ